MRKLATVMCIVLAATMLFSCGKKETEESAYHIYYMNKEKTKIVEQPYEFETEDMNDSEEMVHELLVALITDTDSVEYRKPIPSDVSVLDYSIEGDQLTIFFDQDYSKMSVSEEVLCRAAIVKTLIQIPKIACISFCVGDVPLTDNRGNLVGLMTEDTFVENPGEQINSMQTATLHLYFANETGDALVETEKEVQYSSNISMEKLIVENLLEGPDEKNLKATLPEGTELISVTTTNGICYVNFNEGFMNQNYEIQEAIVIYSIVDSLSEVTTINRVQLLVNGNASGVYRDSFQMDRLYERNLDYVDNATEEVTDTELLGE